jgi:hypothetical protein
MSSHFTKNANMMRAVSPRPAPRGPVSHRWFMIFLYKKVINNGAEQGARPADLIIDQSYNYIK